MTDISSRGAALAVMVVTVVAVSAVATSLLVGGATAAANDDPAPPPAAYFGNLTIDGQNASAGTTVRAVINGSVRGNLTTNQSGVYGGPGADDPKLVVNGSNAEDGNATVTFEVKTDSGFIEANQTVTWVSGDHERVDLSVTTPTPTPTPTETPDGGGGGDGGDGGGGDGGGGGGGGGALPPPSGDSGTDVRVVSATPSLNRISPGGSVEITAVVRNDRLSDARHTVRLYVNGHEADRRSVTVPANATTNVTFRPSFDSAGTYDISLNGVHAGTLTVAEPTPTSTPSATPTATPTASPTQTATAMPTPTQTDTILPGFGLAVGLVAIVATGLLALRRRD